MNMLYLGCGFFILLEPKREIAVNISVKQEQGLSSDRRLFEHLFSPYFDNKI